jgi:hypothetical protein
MALASPDAAHIKLLQRRGMVPVSRLRALTHDLRRMTLDIQQRWYEAPPELQAAFRKLARDLEHPPPLRIRDWLRFAVMSLLAGPDDVKELHEVALRLQDALHAVMAREAHAFQALLKDAEIQAEMASGWQSRGDLVPLQEALDLLSIDGDGVIIHSIARATF